MTQPVRTPVLPFYTDYTANPGGRALEPFTINLLWQEVLRITHTFGEDASQSEPAPAHREAQQTAALYLAKVWGAGPGAFDIEEVQFHWLLLLGYRIGVERHLPVEGIEALVQVASDQLGVPITEAEAWSDEGLFHRYTETALSAEWDYQGLQFRQLVETSQT